MVFIKNSNGQKGNISLIVLFILAITSLLGILAFQNVQSMFQLSGENIFTDKSFYYSKAGVELGVALSNGYGIGFEDKISKTGNINKNFKCLNNKNCGIDFSISNRSRKFITAIPGNDQECTSGNRFKLGEGESLIIPLFVDQRKLSDKNNKKENYKSILTNFEKNQKNIGFELFLENTQTNGTDILLSFAVGSGGNKKIDRDVLFKIFTGIKKNNNVIDDFLFDTKPLYYKENQNKENQNKEDQKMKEIKEPIENKVEKFGQFDNFLIINYPTHCPSSCTNSEEIIKVDDEGKFNCECIQDGFTYSGNLNKCLDKNGNELQISIPKKKLEFCLSVGENLKSDGVANIAYFIDSKGDFSNQQTSLQALKKIKLPDWIFSTAIQKQF